MIQLFSKISCPICENSMYESTDKWKCNNGCYSFMFYEEGFFDKAIEIKVFNETYTVAQKLSNQDNSKTTAHIREQIEYWKENDRYLAEILSNEHK